MQIITEEYILDLSNQIPKSVGEQIVFYRKSKNISQAQLARMIFKDRQHLYKIETGRVTPRITTLAIIAAALDISLSQLFVKIEI